MLLKDIINEMPTTDLNRAETAIDIMFREIGLDVIFSQHFKNRIEDGGSEARDTDVTARELFRAFNALKIQYGDQLLAAKDKPEEFAGLLKDISTHLNIPFVIDYDRPYKGLHKLKAITLMRKQNFKSDNFKSKVLPVKTNINRN